jgi:DNA-binding Lrp family transcriptional regulator
MIGLVQISTELGKEREIAKKLRQVPAVKEVYGTFGHFDMIAIVEGENPQHIGNLVIEKIRSVPGVNITETIITVEL